MELVRSLTVYLSAIAICCALLSCGGCSSSGGPSGTQPDFSLSAEPTTLVIAPDGTQAAQLSASAINGFSGSVQVSATLPSGFAMSPNSFSLSTGTPQQVTISASSGVLPGTVTITLTGQSGSITHTAQLQTEVDLPISSPHPPFRTLYLRTDAQYNPNALQFFPPHFTAYDSVHKRFFVSNPTLNCIDVFDATAESQIGSIIVPVPWGIDVAPDGSKMYASTAFGDVYLIDPLAMSVVQRFPSASLGSQGYAATQPFILANGELVLFGGSAEFNVDGSETFAIWDPTTNNLQVIYPEVFGQAAFVNIGQITLTADRTKVIVASADSDGNLGLYDPTTSVAVSGRAAGIVHEILTTPDGSRIFMTTDEFEVFDANTLIELDSFPFSAVSGSNSAVLSYDGSTLFSMDSYGNVTAYNTSSFLQMGWVPSFNVFDLQQSIVLAVSDETGLVVGPIGHGVAFLDTTQIETGTAQTSFDLGFVSPGTGSSSGGTSVEAQVSEPNATSAVNISSGTIYIGNMTANNISLSDKAATALAPPATTGGPVDVTVVLPDRSIQLNPENFSYGPTIVELSTNAASAEGGAQGVIFGYGLGQQPTDTTVTVGGQPTQVTQVIPTVSTFVSPYPFPMEAVLFIIPPGVAGATATVTVTTASGSSNSAVPLDYVPAVRSYPLSGAALMQGVYDPTRNVIYFTDQSQIDVFSTSGNNWLPPITISYANSTSRLLGIALSPDSNTLAVSDAGNANIYVLSPSSPSTVKSFHVQSNLEAGLQPYGLAVSNSGIVYYDGYDGGIVPPNTFHKLDSNTGQITDYEFGGQSSSYDRVLMSPDGAYVYLSRPLILDTATDSITIGYQAETDGDGNPDMSLSGDGSTLLTVNLLTDTALNVEGDIAYIDRDVWLPVAVYGQKLNEDGSLIFQPLTTGMDVLNGSTGLLVYRVELPIQIANAFDSLVIDNNDGLLFAITANGIAEINLSSLPSAASKQRNSKLKIRTPRVNQIAATVIPLSKSKRASRFDRPHLRHLNSLPLTKSRGLESEAPTAH